MGIQIPVHTLDCLEGMDYRDSQGGMGVMAHLDLLVLQEQVSLLTIHTCVCISQSTIQLGVLHER